MADVSEYEKAMPRVQEHVAQYEKALAEIRTTHAGRPAPEAREALLAAGVRIASEVAQDAAERIADGTL
ncbi:MULTISPECIES: hypothetical protein [Streptomyces]|uniref:hypothetical protein n=1 Tax=Streptomyces TaxID=1883 RepID=UPI000F766491|nr:MULTISPECIES: hypothetical protein [Streptomyces]RST08677.1 hypothetical protein EF910_00005 [Streptomyces sp. WAC07149]GLX23458.1 hypothetical protein Slala01_71020 [Streptomyces lavendulae subsp. lavendulae]GLX30136.1 hypothetical protein Slala02_59560 [Streptomyces lavendulae subsp. lavendulae]